MTRETVELMNAMILNLCDNKYDDDEVEIIFEEIRAGRTKMTLNLKESISISDSFSIEHTCGKCGYKSTDGGEHDCQEPTTNE